MTQHATLLALADLHLHPFTRCSQNNGRDRRDDGLRALDEALRIADERKVDATLIAGDLFNEKGIIDVVTWNQTRDRFTARKAAHEARIASERGRRGDGGEAGWLRLADLDSEIEVVSQGDIIEPGNHDQGDRTGTEHAVRSLDDVAHVFSRPGAIDIGTCIIGVVPWVEVDRQRDAFLAAAREACQAIQILAAESTTKRPWVLMGHTAVAHAITGSDYVFPGEDDPTVADLIALKEEFGLAAIMLGHFHLHQVLAAGICFIGAPKQNTWGEADIRPGCVIWDSRTPDVFEHVPLTAAPRFVRTTMTEALEAAGEVEAAAAAAGAPMAPRPTTATAAVGNVPQTKLTGHFVRIEAQPEEMPTPGAKERLRKRLGARHLEVVPAGAVVESLSRDGKRTERIVLSHLSMEDRIARRIVADHPKDEARQLRLINLAHELYREHGAPEVA